MQGEAHLVAHIRACVADAAHEGDEDAHHEGRAVFWVTGHAVFEVSPSPHAMAKIPTHCSAECDLPRMHVESRAVKNTTAEYKT